MPIIQNIDPNGDLTTFTAEGEISYSEASETISQYYRSSEPGPTKKILWDLRNASVKSLTAYQLTSLANLSVHFSEFRSGGKTAIVAPQDIDFGIARVFEAETMDVPRELFVFRHMREAQDWLGSETE